MTRWLAYAAYLVGSLVFLVVAMRRGSPLIATGSALFVLGTVLYLTQDVLRERRETVTRRRR